MTPFYFGNSSRRLFGVYTPARGGLGGNRAVVFCYPWGQEYLRVHRSMHQLGTQLAKAGFHVLRFDYFGTGDSAGEMTEADIKGWELDIATAIEELKDTAGVSRVGLIGMRLGGPLAARVAAKHPADVDTLVLWDPVVSGKEYLDRVMGPLRTAVLPEVPLLPRRPQVGGGYELMGFALTAAMMQEILSIELLQQVQQFPAKTFIVTSENLPSHEGLRAALAGRAAPTPFEFIASQPAWIEDRGLGSGAIPVKVLQRIMEWLS